MLEKFLRELEDWKATKTAYEDESKRFNNEIELNKKKYLAFEPNAIQDYCRLVLHRSEYPEFVPSNFDIEFNKETKNLIVEIQLPVPEDIPSVIEYKYIKKTDEFAEKEMLSSKRALLYDSIIYQIALRTAHELFEYDVIGSVEAIILNGWVDRLDRSTGQRANVTILSIQTKKSEFLRINLANVDPKHCFQALKGISAARIGSLTPIAPIATIAREDGRFVEARVVAVEEGANLAAIDWEDFEHLVRQMLEREFATEGSEVKVTQASRDGGVDAVVFDPDPLRGGKIIVQAKRYTATVGVSAVRDLYGTVQHEGATKGILVTTAGFGPDAYSFVKGKPLTLLDGRHLLYLLEKHGYKARIDLAEARQASRGS